MNEKKNNTNLSLIAPSNTGGNLLWTDDVYIHVTAAAMLLRRTLGNKKKKQNKIRKNIIRTFLDFIRKECH